MAHSAVAAAATRMADSAAGFSAVIDSLQAPSALVTHRSADTTGPDGFASQPISQLLVKVASRCNIDCTYCYWFRDAAVYETPKLMGEAVLQQLLRPTGAHVSG